MQNEWVEEERNRLEENERQATPHGRVDSPSREEEVLRSIRAYPFHDSAFYAKAKANNTDLWTVLGEGDDAPTTAATTTITTTTNTTIIDECCSICLCELDGEEHVKELACGHCYHASCLDSWLRMKVLCPLCKQVAAPLGTPARERRRRWSSEDDERGSTADVQRSRRLLSPRREANATPSRREGPPPPRRRRRWRSWASDDDPLAARPDRSPSVPRDTPRHGESSPRRSTTRFTSPRSDNGDDADAATATSSHSSSNQSPPVLIIGTSLDTTAVSTSPR